MSFLATLAKTRAKGGSAIPLIEKHLLTSDVSEDRRDRMFHPSNLAQEYFCPREWSLYNFHPDGYAIKEASVDTRLARIFDNGHHVHERLQRYLRDHLWGTWRRLREWDENGVALFDFQHGAFPGPGWVYDEIELWHGADRILGSTDGILRLGSEKWGLEIKSINEDGFKFHLSQGPKKVHKNQVLIYEHALEHARAARLGAAATNFGSVDPFDLAPLDGFIVLYENKNTQELKEFVVPYDADEVEDFMETRRPLMHEALEYERTGHHPVCRCQPNRKSALCAAFPS